MQQRYFKKYVLSENKSALTCTPKGIHIVRAAQLGKEVKEWPFTIFQLKSIVEKAENL